ncbi:DmsC/YnfH family molybdoenzyme membrane anchor subunit [Bacillus sp. FJAT-27445]|uniref:dimethyl sulfoxide reductase anchor subunit family protein n=1 Tax=Bacillus sp. FJAT-27445 TaxID=1679166 RepID=UPI0007432847|nr:DmsC/YnfH family molybdoenzyme membrane anchor subunit [Bacillus sp. FJAT-27445]
MHDLPLVIFTVLSQLLLGGFVALWWLDRKKGGISKTTGLVISISLLILGGVSLLVSMLHLGHPFHAYRAILNIKVSWLSREIAFYGAFLGLMAVYTWFWYKEDAAKRGAIGWIATAIGAIAIFSSAKIYMIPAFPAWDSANTLFAFFLTSLLLGPLYVAVFLVIRGELSVNISSLSIPVLVVSAIVAVVYFSSLAAGLPQAVETAKLTFQHVFFWVRIATFLAASALMLLSYKNSKWQNATVYSAAFAVLLASEFLGRFLFYETAIHL